VNQQRDMKTFCLVRRLDSLRDLSRHNRISEAFESESSMLNTFMANVAAKTQIYCGSRTLWGDLRSRAGYLAIVGLQAIFKYIHLRMPHCPQE
jgi:hypothetical protein